MRRLILVAALACSSTAGAQDFDPAIIRTGNVTLNCPLGAGAGTGDDNFTCSGGETLTFARSTVSYACPRTDSENTAVWEEAINAACFIDTCGVTLARSFVNRIVRSEAFDNASWVDVGTPVRAAGAADSPLNGADSDTLADSIQDDSALTQEGVGQQYLAANAVSLQNISVWATVASGTLAFSMCVLTGTDTCNTSNGCCTNQTATTAWQRFSASATTGTTSQTKNFRIVIGNDGTTATTGTLLLWGASAEATTALPPYCRSTGASATTCANETLTATPDNVLAWQGAVEVTVEAFWHPLNTSAADDVNGSGTQPRFWAFYTGSLVNERSCWVQNNDTLNCVNANAAGALSFWGAANSPEFTVGTAITMWGAWGAGQRTYGNGQTVLLRVATDANAPGAVPTTFRIGGASHAATSIPGACLRDFRVYRVPPSFMR